MDRHWPSPLTIARLGHASPGGTLLPSTSTSRGLHSSWATASAIAQSAAGVLFAATYVVLFSIPLTSPAPPAVRLAALSGLVVTAAFIVLALFPITDVQSSTAYAAKIVAAVAIANGVGIAIALSARRA